MTLEFENTLDEDIYIDWPGIQPDLVLMHNTIELKTHRDCLPFCGEGCACSTCAPTQRVRRVAAGQTLTVTWTPIHFALNACGESASCSCVESWPITAGHYELSVSGFTDAEGGEPTVDNPDLLIGATPGATSKTCVAKGEFDLAGGATMRAEFSCP